MLYSGQMIRFFISSTFHDMHQERNVLQLKVFPDLRQLCREKGVRFQAIDLRWGVSEEASQDHRTLAICLDEIKRCREISPAFNFLVLLGDRHGSNLLPEQIEQREFEMLLDTMTTDHQHAINPWYKLDTNARSPAYVLQPRNKGQFPDYKAWEREQNILYAILKTASERAGLSDTARLPYLASATEMEIEKGVFDFLPEKQEPLCFFRTIMEAPQGKDIGLYIEQDPDKQKRLELIKSRLKVRCSPDSVYEYEARWAGDGCSDEHLANFAERAKRLLRQHIEATLQIVERSRSVPGVDLEANVLEEFAEDRLKHFVERDESEAMSVYIADNTLHPLIVAGAAGSGKSTLLLHIEKTTHTVYPTAHVERTYIGVTPNSSNTRALLEHLCKSITRAYGGDETTIPADETSLIEDFPERLKLATAERPLVVFIDALDQLSGNDQRTDWIPRRLPQYVRMVVSILSNTEEEQDTLRKDFPQSTVLVLGKMTREQGNTLLSSWLEDAGRELQPKQRNAVLDAFVVEGLPLYLRLAYEEARLWPSYLQPISDLKSTIPGIMKDLFERLAKSKNHGSILVAHSMGYLAAACHGLSEDEMLDILAADPDVITAIKEMFPASPEIKLLQEIAKPTASSEPQEENKEMSLPFPVVLWSRLFFDLNAYLNQRSADGANLISFYHQQLKEVVEELYLQESTKLMRHRVLSKYFKEQGLVNGNIANLRKMAELPYQQTEGELWDELYVTLTDFYFLEQKAATGKQTHVNIARVPVDTYTGIYELQRDFEHALARWPQLTQTGVDQ